MLFQRTAILSNGIRRIDNLDAFFPETASFFYYRTHPFGGFDSVIGWGKKSTAASAIALSERCDLPYIAIEDGFLRSVGIGATNEPAIGLVIDPVGIYYDANSPSLIENLINHPDWFDEQVKRRAQQAITLLCTLKLSKYNCFDANPPKLDPSAVLVIDQTLGDASVTLGGSDQADFDAMLQAAIDHDSEATVYVKQHPDVLLGTKQSYLQNHPLLSHPRVELLRGNPNPWDIFAQIDAVYVVTSQLGMEAIFADIPVFCFGQPFYSSWGLTTDTKPVARRKKTACKHLLFAAAYFEYSRYVDPITGKATTFEQAVDLIHDQRHQAQQRANRSLSVHFSLWKKGFMPHYLHYNHERRFVRQLKPRHLEQIDEQTEVVSWGQHSAAIKVKLDRIAHHTRVEDGFLRSVGLGSNLARPCSLVLDKRGIYFNANAPSDLEHYLQNSAFTPYLLNRAERLHQAILDASISKYNDASFSDAARLPDHKKTILVVGQVEGDASIIYGQSSFQTNRAFIETVRAKHPDAFIIFKPHPDVVVGNRKGAVSKEVTDRCADLLLEKANLIELVRQVDEVHVMTSLVGFEALLHGKSVTTYGLPFYAGWGLTHDNLTCERRTTKRNITELVAATLLLYPCYVHPEAHTICTAEHIVSWLSANKGRQQKVSLRTRFFRLFKPKA
ncbi:MAG: capsular polysaccharide biosynthesis protein [Pseudomonadota bacterium]|nr:capsular polysaccharide biosynthesis protein [Pseudomonadota bacterium]